MSRLQIDLIFNHWCINMLQTSSMTLVFVFILIKNQASIFFLHNALQYIADQQCDTCFEPKQIERDGSIIARFCKPAEYLKIEYNHKFRKVEFRKLSDWRPIATCCSLNPIQTGILLMESITNIFLLENVSQHSKIWSRYFSESFM